MTRQRTKTALVLVIAAVGGATVSGSAGAAQRQGGSGSSGVAVLFGGSGQGRPVASYSIPFTTTGELSIRFHGDQTAGCARWGLCPYQGQIAASPAQRGEILLSKYRHHGRDAYAVVLAFTTPFGGTGFAFHTVRLVNGRVAGLCADTNQNLIVAGSRVGSGRLTLKLFGPGAQNLATRCAGPLDADVARAAPQTTVTVRRLLRGGGEIRLTGDHRFVGHGFAGSVSSTIVLRLGEAHRHTVTVGPPHNGKTVRLRTISERLDLTRTAGGLHYAFHGSANATVCQLLDSCGLDGTANLKPVFTHVSAELSATAPASRPRRDLLTALGLARGGNPKGILLGGYITWRDRGSFTESVTQSGTCTDRAPLGSGYLALSTRGSAIHAIDLPPRILRTRCPGPMLETGGTPLPGEVLSKHAVTRSRFTIDVRPAVSELDDGYVIRPSGQISLTLKRTGHTTERVFRVPRNAVSVYTHSPG